MRLATIRLGDQTAAVRVEGTTAIETGFADVGALLRAGGLEAAATADGARHDVDTVDLAPVVPNPGKIVCVGLNYRNHILEMGRELPEHPTLFAKYPEALIGPRDEIQLPPESDQVDWEGELAVVIGKRVRRASAEEAKAAIAGYSVLNDVTMRDYQYRTLQWLQGKTWENTTPFGPVLVTEDEIPADAQLVTTLDGEEVQRTPIDDLVFDAAALVRYISTIVTLQPGDVIATGTPGGVGHARKPARYLAPGQKLTTSVDGIGELVNVAVQEKTAV
ncbi:fumarylacetoacetate hydrolase family protein [Saccharomonospora viridis]|jgi:acylpyruvate hydrolase|uniref:2-keto-4-pentenoate hydratase/2-oxohepta-3-ene-1,7-dioic acid hydratase n=1 Tax=Saccharomonospora viridis (strain ATCC 15386 / DSM 43017 / JCM 3036 / CCUG 5913 / NBRC 12207 / NCIMB 9602 / P101) TaxID=471857 RepID=C7MVY2_SACVD|nr:fumarylacetoacetate hydrolase family protein [Saccharomonospora viridis]ACU97082.1 2-keto-4-pentenoate hydratase/2-oxohepta-3-ene-1,7-dioic acid hydratase [Saccharomonospora viridis DSM 43017]